METALLSLPASPIPITLFTVVAALFGLYMLNDLYQPFEGRFEWGPDPGAPSLESIHQALLLRQSRLPRTAEPLPPSVEEFLRLARAAELSDWNDSYCRNLESNPTTRDAVKERLPRLLKEARRQRRLAILGSAGAAALATVPERHHVEWETAALLAAWASALDDRLSPEDRALFSGPFRVAPVPPGRAR